MTENEAPEGNRYTTSVGVFQKMIEDLLKRAHASGNNVWHGPINGVYIGGLWVTKEQNRRALAASMNAFGQRVGPAEMINPPSLDGDYSPEGDPLENPVLKTNSALGIGALIMRKLENRAADAGEERVLFDSGTRKYPSLVFVLT